MQFDFSKAKKYRKKDLVFAFPNPHPATYYLKWAGRKGQQFKGDHMTMIRLNPSSGLPDEVYGCAMTEFYQTYERLHPADINDHWRNSLRILGFQPSEESTQLCIYRKRALVDAYQVDEDTVIQNITAGAKTEVETLHIKAGEWVVRNPSGDTYKWDAVARQMFEEVPA